MRTHFHTEDRQATIAWAQALLAQPDVIILDTETTGIGRDDEAVSIGIVDGSGAVLMDTLLRPRKAISPGAMRVHGIQNRDVDKAPRFAEVYPELAGYVNDRTLVVYNLDFDWRILRYGCSTGKLPLLKPKASHCAMKQFAQFDGDWDPGNMSYRWKSLSAACARFGISSRGAHSAVADCLLTLEVLRHMATASP